MSQEEETKNNMPSEVESMAKNAIESQVLDGRLWFY